MALNIKRLKKSEIEWLWKNKCKHKHNYLEHYSCYLSENPQESPMYEKTAAFDIECSNLKATFGIIFSYALRLEDGTLLGRALTPSEMKRGIYDKELLKEMVSDIRQVDRTVGWFSSLFDNNFCLSRCLLHDIPWIQPKEVKHTDLWKFAKRKLALHRNSLQCACDFLGIPAKGHPIKSDVWFKAMAGRKDALEYIFTHNVEDVDSTMEVYKKVKPYLSRSSVFV